jgi:ACS family hexuronate transporter-like MFS transporter
MLPGGARTGPPLDRRVAAIAGLLLLASAINYMDRQTLANVSVRVTEEFGLTNQQYGRLEEWFAYAFAAGSLVFGVLADRVSVRWLYPAALLAWSAVGFVTGFATDYQSLLVCRGVLGFFEAAHWPCALKTTQVLLSARGRTLGNGILQSGTSIGSIVTPLVIWWLLVRQGHSWRFAFQLVGLVGTVWIAAWLAVTRAEDFHLRDTGPVTGAGPGGPAGTGWLIGTGRKLAAVLVVVTVINTVWQILRAWIPKILQQEHGYPESTTLWFTAGWFAMSDIGCIASGWFAWWLAGRGWSVKWSRVATFALCCIPCLGLVAMPGLSAGPLLLTVLLVAGAGALGMFPIYYSFTQDISRRHQGLVTGVASFVAWIASAWFQQRFGRLADKTQSFSIGLAAAGGVTLVALAAWALLWPDDARGDRETHTDGG